VFNQWVTQQLDVQPDSHILEVGSGPGVTLQALAARACRTCRGAGSLPRHGGPGKAA
jgi:cyclopropane fatty-acyl-phospholipid synthase-like methyltransferase